MPIVVIALTSPYKTLLPTVTTTSTFSHKISMLAIAIASTSPYETLILVNITALISPYEASMFGATSFHKSSIHVALTLHVSS